MRKWTKRLILAGIGAAALTKKEIRQFLQDMRRKGIDEKRGKEYLQVVLRDIQQSTNEIADTVNKKINAFAGKLEIGEKGGKRETRRKTTQRKRKKE